MESVEFLIVELHYPSAFGCKGYCHEHDGRAGRWADEFCLLQTSAPSIQNDLKLIWYIYVVL